ncbi:peptidylprolyl isomerase [Paenibacillus faecis]|uniref:peptidylprolyl isomerase n=2 Tax=Paenibacillus TaxID=44249 RepID=A0A5D0CP18_9BACL|nr:peptidylprolyl isomerase [Paenibacillus faecis]
MKGVNRRMDEKEKKEWEVNPEQPEEGREPAAEGQASVQNTEETTGAETAESPESPKDEKEVIPEVNLAQSETIAMMSAVSGEGSEEDAPASGGTAGAAGKSGKVWPIISLVLAALLVVVLVKPPFVPNKAEAVATVNGKEITKDQLYDELSKAGGGEAALDELIMKELVRQEAAKKNITVTAADIDKEIETYKKNFGSEENLNLALTQSGMTMELLRENLEMNQLLTKILEPEVKVTDEQVKQTFEENKASFDTPEQVRASVILVKTEAEANEIIKELKAGKDFAELAKSKSLDEATKANGGDTDFFARGEREEAVENAAFKLAKDEISGAVKTSEGYQVIKLTDRKEAHSATLEEKKEEIRKTLVSQQVSQLSGSWLNEVRNKANIKNMLTDGAENSAAESNKATK